MQKLFYWLELFFFFSFVYLSFFLFFQFARSTYSPVVCSTTFFCVVTQRSSVAWRHKERLWSRLSPADVHLTGNSSYFLQYLFKDTLIWLFSLFSNSPQEKYLKRFMIILDWLQIELKSRKCWKEKNHGHRHEVSSLGIRGIRY